MNNLQWNTPQQLRSLLCEVVSWDSRTHTEGERQFPLKLKQKLLENDYFLKHPDYLSLHEADAGRSLVTALYKHPNATDTIVLISHFDTVQTEEYGDLEHLAFHPEQLTKELFNRSKDLKQEARVDLESGNYLFGRGTMDMKMGLVLHMSMIEKAIAQNWPINLILVTVPDEEVNSSGMRAAVKVLVSLRNQFSISYKLFLNGEPSFTQKPGDENYYIYSGTIGKIMPAALFYGKETHVGEPLAGITANYIASFLTQSMEWNSVFCESDRGESTPLPVSLQQKDLKLQYSTQTPYRAVALYNVFLMKRTAQDIMNLFEQVALEAAKKCNEAYKTICAREQIQPIGEVRVMRYQELLSYAEKKLGKNQVEKILNEVLTNDEWDEREKSLRAADHLLIRCNELAPAIILLFAPPYYPAVNSSDDPLIEETVQLVTDSASKEFGMQVNQIHYFNGLCDLSYVNYQDESDGWTTFEQNTPTWGAVYNIPFQEMSELQTPVLNIGPFGKDAHQSTERVSIESAFVQTPMLIERVIKSLFASKVAK
ncbi:M20/M25/M40 family metallo-hydrolase [Ureibacillus manganicus]|uniref:Amino acid degradation protein n=1 Tax=Ureibacillus manganicus DSM 26584 TaxID=1384049 RepID=A0A0A3I2B8_9BACL|nr:M20/M25/M40 family metallo-hydrolase [Ureibacillus manganicus]KGR78971.1 amino acid degradation protein [Ureibacillus manganicus DSM 26584]